MKIDPRLIAVPIALLLAGCATPTSERRYVGAGPACGGVATRATLVRRGPAVTLTPDEGTIVLRGTVDAAGNVQANWSPPVRGTVTSRTQPPATRTATGTIDSSGARLDFVAPGCEAILELRPPNG